MARFYPEDLRPFPRGWEKAQHVKMNPKFPEPHPRPPLPSPNIFDFKSSVLNPVHSSTTAAYATTTKSTPTRPNCRPTQIKSTDPLAIWPIFKIRGMGRKQNFGTTLDSEEEIGREGDSVPTDEIASNSVATTTATDANTPAILEPASKIVLKKASTTRRKWKLLRNSSSEDEEVHRLKPTPTFTAPRIMTRKRRRRTNRFLSSSEEETSKPGGPSDIPPSPQSELEPDAEPMSEDRARKFKRGKYSCPTCPDVKNYGIGRFVQHLDIHRRRPYKCTICNAFIHPDEESMLRHLKEKHSTSTSFPDVDQLQKHFLKVSLDNLNPGEIWKCEGCSDGFLTEADRGSHELECTSLLDQGTRPIEADADNNSPYSCQTCTKPSRNIEEWRLHRVLFHPEVDRISCICCDRSFAEKTVDGVEIRNDRKMMDHIKLDHPYHFQPGSFNYQYPTGRIYDECESCGVVFLCGRGKDAAIHFLEAHGIPKGGLIFPCPLSCGSMFTTGLGVRNHVGVHHLPRELHICDVCGETFKRAEGLRNHRFRQHGIQPEGWPTWTCPVEGCDFKAIQNQDLALHSQMVHGDERKYACKYCGKGFSDSSKLNVHHQIHENQKAKPYQCEICGNSFAVRNYLYIHKRLSHEGRTFPSTNRKREPSKIKTGKGNGDARKRKRSPSGTPIQVSTPTLGAGQMETEHERNMEEPQPWPELPPNDLIGDTM